MLLARRVLPVPLRGCMVCPTDEAPPTDWGAALRKAWRRFLRRLPKLVYFTAPIYVLMFLLQRYGFFDLAEQWLAEHMGWLGFLKPQAMGIIVLHLAAELGAALGAAAACCTPAGFPPATWCWPSWWATSFPRPCAPCGTSSRPTPVFSVRRWHCVLFWPTRACAPPSMALVTVFYYYAGRA